MIYDKECILCHQEFATSYPNQKFCSRKCSRLYKELNGVNKEKQKNSNKKNLTMKCMQCGKEYSLLLRKGIFCSDNCEKTFNIEHNEYYNETADIIVGIYHKKCLYCNSDFVTDDSDNNFCSDSCLHKYIDKEKDKVNKPPKYFINTCKICGVTFKTPYQSNEFCSRECLHESNRMNVKLKQKLSGEIIEWIELYVELLIKKALDGGEHTKQNHYINYYNISGFNESLKRRILERDNYECVICKSKGSLHVHHIVPRQYGGTHKEDNLITLCAKCHGTIETRDIVYAKRKCVKNAIINLESKEIKISKNNNAKISEYINEFLLLIINEDIKFPEDIKILIFEKCTEILDNIDLLNFNAL